MRTRFLLLFIILVLTNISFSQFGRNKVQFKDSEWYFIQTTHFDIYFNSHGSRIAEFAAKAAEDALTSIEHKINYRINSRITIILYNSQNDFQETNVIDEYLSEGIGGVTELFKNRVILPFTGDYKMFRHVIHHELVHAVMNDMFYGGSIQNIISKNISIRFPIWFSEGISEYLSLGWDTNTDMFIRDAATSEYLPDIEKLDDYFAYRGGQCVFYYIAKKYGEEKIAEIFNKIRSKGNVEDGIQASIGLKIEELNERWKKEIKREYWPEIALRKDPDEFSKRLTDHRKDGSFFNSSPAISPQGDKIAFITNRDFYFDVYLMNAADGKIIKRIVKGNRTADFEELNILTPGLTWSPDGKKISLSAKSNGYDVIYIIDVDEDEIDQLPLKLDGIASVNWSPDGNWLTFSGSTSSQSDIYLYSFESKDLVNLTGDIFSDMEPSWSPDGNKIFFSSDRGNILEHSQIPENFFIADHNYSQKDLYYYDIKTKSITRLTDMPNSDESYPLCSPDGNEILFISDVNGINNIYKKRIVLQENDSVKTLTEIQEVPVTNSLNGLYQISISKDGKKLAFASMYQAAYNIFLLNNPFDIKLDQTVLLPTPYIASKLKKKNGEIISIDSIETKKDTIGIKVEETQQESFKFFTGQYVDSSKTDTSRTDYSRYIFGSTGQFKTDTIRANENKDFLLTDNMDSAGNFRVNKYKINFSPDIIYANAGYNTLYGLLGTTVLAFSDVLGNHRIIAQTSLQIDLKNSDYGVAYYYLPKRWDLGIEGFHTARFVYLTRGISEDLFRFRNYGAVLSLSYPINQFYRFDFGLSLLNVSSENLDDPSEETQKANYLVPAISFVHDNTIFGYTAPIDGTRYRFDLFGNPLIQRSKFEFYSLIGDYRNYNKFWTDYSFAFRLSGGLSNGKNKQRFFVGGIDNWINRRFATQDFPVESPNDFAFLTAALPMRGFNYAEKIGTRYALMNAEFRFPLIRYFLSGVLPILFRDVQGVAFIDAGTAWNKDNQLQLFAKNANGTTVTKDLLIGTGFGARVFLFAFLLRFDVAWAYYGNEFSRAVFYFSLGTDF